MFSLHEAVETVERLVKDLEPGLLDGKGAREALEGFARMERLAQAGKMLCAKRVDETFVAGSGAHRSAASWIAQAGGESLGSAIAGLQVVKAMESLPHLGEAMRSGDVSLPQAKEIASAALACPASEAELVREAPRMDLRRLRERCGRLRARAASARSESARLEAIRASRYLHHWNDHDGATRIDARLAPDDGAAVIAAISAARDAAFRSARDAGRQEPFDAYGADALVALVTGAGAAVAAGGSSRPPAQVSVRVDASALRRGFVEGDECCEIPGVGPVPVATARDLLGDAWVRLVVTEGVEVASICHAGRTVPAHLRSALEERDPTCVVPGCRVADGLEIDHWALDFAEGGPTRLSNLARVCHVHHLLKTHHGYRLEGGPGRWAWLAPGDEGGAGPPPGEHPSGQRSHARSPSGEPPPAPAESPPTLFSSA